MSTHRVHAFPHVRGRWPCSVYLPIDSDSNFKSLVSSALDKNCAELIGMKQLKWELHKQDFHTSLSKEFTLCQYQLSHFIKSVKKAVETRFSTYNMALTDECVIHVILRVPGLLLVCVLVGTSKHILSSML